MTPPLRARAMRCDIFCRVIDNFGDIGVTWRLARQLAEDHGWRIRLLVDDASALQWMAPDRENVAVDLINWPGDAEPAPTPVDVDVVIEAFACALPAAYQDHLLARPQRPVWLNLEYLTAERFAADHHGLTSPHPATGALKHFFFPGFVRGTGGILREPDYADRRARFAPRAFMAELRIPVIENELLVSMFAYPSAPQAVLHAALANYRRPVRLLCPGMVGDCVQSGALTLQPLAMLPQSRYDELLWLCDLNFVRGEDSWVRAQLAGKPMIWQAYPQPDEAHLDKLEAFLDLYLNAPDALADADHAKVSAGGTAIFRHLCTPLRTTLRDTWHAWNTGQSADWPVVLDSLAAWHTLARCWQSYLLDQEDLANRLVRFCCGKHDGIK